MKDVGKYDADSIWLFSVELFHKELLKFNLKIKAQNAEEKQAIEEAVAKREAKVKAKAQSRK